MKYTPFEITESKQFFSIPIYQRLFEWDTDNIVTLLDDLYKNMNNPMDNAWRRRLLYRNAYVNK